MRTAMLWLLLSSLGLAQSSVIASRRYGELTPLQYHFGPFKAMAPYNNVPNFTISPTTTIQPSSAITDSNTFSSTSNFTVVRQTDLGTTFSVSANQGTITTGTSSTGNFLLTSNAAVTNIPDLFFSVKVITQGSTGLSNGQLILGISDPTAANQFRIDWQNTSNSLLIGVVKASTFTTVSTTPFTAPSLPFYLGMGLINRTVSAWYSTDGVNWNLISYSDVSGTLDPTTVDLTTYKTEVGTFSSASTTWVISNLATGVTGGVSADNFRAVTWPDGRPYRRGSVFYFTASAPLVSNSFGSVGHVILSYDVSNGTMTLLGSIGQTISGSVSVLGPAHIIYDPDTGTERMTFSRWTSGGPGGIWYVSQSIATDDWLSSSVHTHIAPSALQMTLPNDISAYDDMMVCSNWNYSANTCGKWLMFYAGPTGTTSSYAHAASTTSDPSSNSWTSVLNDSTQGGYEGAETARTATTFSGHGVAYTGLFGGNYGVAHYFQTSRVYDQSGGFLGNLSAPIPAQSQLVSHFSMFSYGNTQYLIAFNGNIFSNVGTFTIGDLGIATAPKYSAQANWPTMKNGGSSFSSSSVSSLSISTGDTGSITAAVGDIVVVMCRAAANPPGAVVASDSLGNTFTCLGPQNPFSSGTYDQACYAGTSGSPFITTGGTDTLTCGGGNAGAFAGITFLQFSPGFLTGLDAAPVYSNQSSGTPYTSSGITTTAKGLIVVCADIRSGVTYVPGLIGPYLGSFGVGQNSGASSCFGTLTYGAQTGITATAASTTAASATWGGAIFTFK